MKDDPALKMKHFAEGKKEGRSVSPNDDSYLSIVSKPSWIDPSN
jgi:hypothetical protein